MGDADGAVDEKVGEAGEGEEPGEEGGSDRGLVKFVSKGAKCEKQEELD